MFKNEVMIFVQVFLYNGRRPHLVEFSTFIQRNERITSYNITLSVQNSIKLIDLIYNLCMLLAL